MKKLLYRSIPLGDSILYWSMFVVFFCILILFFTGCKTTESKARDYFSKHPDKFADLAGQYFAPATKYIQGESILTPGDTVLIPGDSIPCPDKKDGSIVPVRVKCPDSKIIHDTIKRVDTTFIENTGKIDAQAIELIAIKHENDRLNSHIDDLKHQRWYIFLFGMLMPFIAFGAFKLALKLFL